MVSFGGKNEYGRSWIHHGPISALAAHLSAAEEVVVLRSRSE